MEIIVFFSKSPIRIFWCVQIRLWDENFNWAEKEKQILRLVILGMEHLSNLLFLHKQKQKTSRVLELYTRLMLFFPPIFLPFPNLGVHPIAQRTVSLNREHSESKPQSNAISLCVLPAGYPGGLGAPASSWFPV